jgi:hypothetical protein
MNPLFVLISASALMLAQQSPEAAREVEAGLELIRGGDALADSGKVNEAQIRYHEAMERILPSVRSLALKNPVKRDETPREKLGQVLVEEWEKDVSPEKFRRDEATWKNLGLIPPEFDLKGAYVKLLTEEVAAFYDPKTKTMHLIREPEDDQAAKARDGDEAKEKPKGLLELIMGPKPKFDKDGARIVIAHELTHALGDQHFDLNAMLDAVKNDDDAALALSALIEGDATLTMMAVSQGDWTGTQIVDMPAQGLSRLVRWFGPFLPMMGGTTARNSPPVMYQSLLFPYVNGLVFCAHLTNAGGWPALDAAYRNPPLSTEQIIHPEKYSGPLADPPTAIDLGEIHVPEGWKDLGRNCIGELTIRILLARNGGNQAAAGWDGDTMAVFAGSDDPKRLAMVWMTTWDTEADADHFAASIRKTWQNPSEPLVATQTGATPKLFPFADGFAQQTGKDVLIVRGFDRKTAEALSADVTRKHTKREKTFPKIERKNAGQ